MTEILLTQVIFICICQFKCDCACIALTQIRASTFCKCCHSKQDGCLQHRMYSKINNEVVCISASRMSSERIGSGPRSAHGHADIMPVECQPTRSALIQSRQCLLDLCFSVPPHACLFLHGLETDFTSAWDVVKQATQSWGVKASGQSIGCLSKLLGCMCVCVCVCWRVGHPRVERWCHPSWRLLLIAGNSPELGLKGPGVPFKQSTLLIWIFSVCFFIIKTHRASGLKQLHGWTLGVESMSWS